MCLFDLLVNSDKSSNFKLLNYNIYKPFNVMFTDNKVIEIFCLVDDFCQLFDSLLKRYSIDSEMTLQMRSYHRSSTLSKVEMMLILIMFHASGYRCLKHYNLR